MLHFYPGDWGFRRVLGSLRGFAHCAALQLSFVSPRQKESLSSDCRQLGRSKGYRLARHLRRVMTLSLETSIPEELPLGIPQPRESGNNVYLRGLAL